MPDNTQSGVVVINPEGKAEQYSQPDANKLLQQGYQVPLIDSNGNPVSASVDEARRLVQQGSHREPQTEHLQELLKHAHYDTPKQQAIAFIEGALEANSMGLSNKLLADTGITTNEDILARRETHPGTHAMGEVAGTVAGIALAPEASLPGIISKAGKAAAEGIRLEGTFGRLAQAATKNAIEGGLLTSQHEIGEHLIDPHSTAEHMVANIGIGAALSGGFGAALSGLSPAISKAVDFAKNPNLGHKLMDKGVELLGKSVVDVPLRAMGVPGMAREYLKDKAVDVFRQLSESSQAQSVLNTLTHVTEIADKSTKLIEKYAGGIFGKTAQTLLEKPEEHKDLGINSEKLDKLKGLMEVNLANPEGFINNLDNNLAPIKEQAPQLAQAITMAIGNAVNFLNSKVPVQEQGSALDALPKLSKSEIINFNRYVKVADNPTFVMERLKQGNLLHQDIETLATVYPALYGNMKEALTKNLVDYKSKKNPEPLPYKTILSLSMFLGEPLVNSLKPMNLLDNQKALQSIDMQNNAEKQMQQSIKPNKAGIGKLKSFERDQTITQRTAMRKSI